MCETVSAFYYWLVKQSNVLNLKLWGVMNTKMSLKIYTSSDRRSVILYMCMYIYFIDFSELKR
jgi:hypothetical protein